MIAGWVIAVLALALLVLMVKYRRLALDHARVRRDNGSLQRQLLKARLDPHFLFNALSSIQSLVNGSDKESALKYLSRFAALLREIMLEPGDRMITLQEEMKLLNHYLALESLRFDHRFSWQVQAEDGLDVHGTEVPILIIQPFVENAVRHGLAPKGGEGSINVHFSKGGDHTVCVIRDDGIGRHAAGLRRKMEGDRPSQGLEITRRRLALAESDSGDQSIITIRDLYAADGKPCGTEVTVRIPKTND